MKLNDVYLQKAEKDFGDQRKHLISLTTSGNLLIDRASTLPDFEASGSQDDVKDLVRKWEIETEVVAI